MAADRLVTYGNQATYGARKIRKVDVVGGHALLTGAGDGALVGVLATRLTAALVQAGIDAPAPPANDLAELHDWADGVALTASSVLADATPPVTITENDKQIIDGALLLGYAGHLWYLFTNQAAWVDSGVATLGIGSEIALGAAVVALNGGATPRAAADRAVRLACDYIPGCGLGPSLPPLSVQLDTPVA
jgi:hypothetical protein